MVECNKYAQVLYVFLEMYYLHHYIYLLLVTFSIASN